MKAKDVANLYEISIANLTRWKKWIERREGAGRKISDPELEKNLIEWIQQENRVINSI